MNEVKKTEAAVWIKQTKKGEDYLSISCTCMCGMKNNVNAFLNSYKTDPKHPDYKSAKDKTAQPQAPVKQPELAEPSITDDKFPF